MKVGDTRYSSGAESKEMVITPVRMIAHESSVKESVVSGVVDSSNTHIKNMTWEMAKTIKFV
jgi:hypothetical protein